MKTGYVTDKQNRSALIESELASVKKIAYYYFGRIKSAVEIEDLLQIGFLGLVDASHRYIETEQGSFKAYASIRIKGAIVDYLRKSSNLCRTTIANRKKLLGAEKFLLDKLGRLPTDIELSENLGISLDDLFTWRKNFQANQLQSLDEVHNEFSEWFADFTAPVEDQIYLDELKKGLRISLDGLKPNEALVLQLYYVEELNIYEIAEIMEISTGRVSQLKSAAISFIRDDLRKRDYI
jgi:RNA polymerase sigma factor for flagellar operon FliA